MIQVLKPVINQKCQEIQAERKSQLQQRLFITLCIMAVILPTLLVLMGVSLTMFIAPLVFMSISVIFLLPVLLKNENTEERGILHE
ncbi:MAG: hypothetical protein SOI44_09480 [Lactimicrobium sp.]|uniref:hypothetical protein n=1 Tax=Lactimicrobium sp. TaxID=2563780 RepID=UPI002F34FE88